MKTRLFFALLLITALSNAQETSIAYELNGRKSNQSLEAGDYKTSINPFVKFIGEWGLKNDDWTQNWGGETETIKIPGHHTVSSQINTDNSLLSIIDGPEPNGHIFWSFNPNTKEVFHSSSFGTIRAGQGQGTVNENGDLRLKISFEGEPKNTYRIYTYTWVSLDEYALKSVQFDASDKPTGLFYQGNFVRIKKDKADLAKQEILKHGAEIRAAFAEGDVKKIESLHHPEVKKALGFNDTQVGREAVINGIKGTLENFRLEFVKNEVESILIERNIAIEQTRFSIKGTPLAGGESFIFGGRTMVTYIRYPESPTGWATIREIIQPESN
ncbi:nuclear transport factor 2 family protein [Roseivirga misakiensis]|uniref:DUF4440 domain-containing protein n=1 Tax=Roseivirga misakiensis TaxID=1563681 RepID=A0A1E5SL21_9BACT|nr:nuclear transport factor 2 family protein [Roseivirga misakiensis]OEJ99824.1 hypothetical protein BFP71_09745 [Roseivirga misakiensis]